MSRIRIWFLVVRMRMPADRGQLGKPLRARARVLFRIICFWRPAISQILDHLPSAIITPGFRPVSPQRWGFPINYYNERPRDIARQAKKTKSDETKKNSKYVSIRSFRIFKNFYIDEIFQKLSSNIRKFFY